jgi:hypothetical protein
MPKSTTQFLQHIEMNRDTDADINAHINKDVSALPPSRRNYSPWSFVDL